MKVSEHCKFQGIKKCHVCDSAKSCPHLSDCSAGVVDVLHRSLAECGIGIELLAGLMEWCGISGDAKGMAYRARKAIEIAEAAAQGEGSEPFRQAQRRKACDAALGGKGETDG